MMATRATPPLRHLSLCCITACQLDAPLQTCTCADCAQLADSARFLPAPSSYTVDGLAPHMPVSPPSALTLAGPAEKRKLGVATTALERKGILDDIAKICEDGRSPWAAVRRVAVLYGRHVNTVYKIMERAARRLPWTGLRRGRGGPRGRPVQPKLWIYRVARQLEALPSTNTVQQNSEALDIAPTTMQRLMTNIKKLPFGKLVYSRSMGYASFLELQLASMRQTQGCLLIAIYSWTDARFTKTLEDLARRLEMNEDERLGIYMIVDRAESLTVSMRGALIRLLRAGVKIKRPWRRNHFYHLKEIVVDLLLVLSGSANASKKAHSVNYEDRALLREKVTVESAAMEFWETYHCAMEMEVVTEDILKEEERTVQPRKRRPRGSSDD